MKSRLQAWWGLLGFEPNTTSHHEKLISAVGGGLGIAAVYGLSHWALDGMAAGLMVASMGASAVLLFAVPHGTLSQPWPIIAGHCVSGFVGVSCYLLFGNSLLSAAMAVGVAVIAMAYLRCIHPPGGATALAAVIGGPAVHSLGYGYLLTPVAVNLIAILAVGFLFNNAFYWRRYPVGLMVPRKSEPGRPHLALSHEDFAAAMHALDTYIDVSSEELAQLFDRAWEHARAADQEALKLLPNHYYSNGQVGDRWCVRQVFDVAEDQLNNPCSQLAYRVVAGLNKEQTGRCRVDEFHQWAKFRVTKQGERWIKAA
ncbi:HPP family protein [Gilvimarinus polysaccharolyticus]|uniref:HPP family protein n=1 Tax=Gilvimarinus polysaccharolyticus TaxID=863921 RepID=UPI0009FE7478|nr:HPP family protein [Gilvimarinus polysaccharolyticus]